MLSVVWLADKAVAHNHEGYGLREEVCVRVRVLFCLPRQWGNQTFEVEIKAQGRKCTPRFLAVAYYFVESEHLPAA